MKYLALLFALLISAPCFAQSTGAFKGIDDRYYPNLLSNSQFQVLTALPSLMTKPSNIGIGLVPTFNVTSCPNTGPRKLVTINVTPSSSNQIFPNALVQLAGSGVPTGLLPYAASGSGISTTLRVLPGTVVTNTSGQVTAFQVLAPYIYTGGSCSGTVTGTVVTRGDSTGSTGDGPDAWKKFSQIILWMEDDPVNIPPMAVRSVALEKTSNAEQDFYQPMDAGIVRELQGNYMSCSFTLNQKVRGGSGTWQPYAQINGTKYYGVPVPIGQQYAQENGIPIPPNATSINAGVALNGLSGDVYDLANPICIKAANMPQNYYVQRSESFYVNAGGQGNPADIKGSTYTFVPSASSTSCGSGFNGFDMDLMGEFAGEFHSSLKAMYADMEVNVPTVTGSAFNFQSFNTTGHCSQTQANIFPQNAGQTISHGGYVGLGNGQFPGQFAVIYGAPVIQTVNNWNIDVWSFQLGD
jgi:hypothetical protein